MSKFKIDKLMIVWGLMFIGCCALIVYMAIIINRSLDAAQYDCPKGSTKITMSNGWGCQKPTKGG
jgi:hypothetical protein